MKLTKMLLSLEGKYYCLLIIFILSGSISIIYWQHSLLINEINSDIEKEITLSQAELDEFFNACNALLKVVDTKIVERNIANNPKAISELLKQFYMAPYGENGSRVNLIDINWQGNNAEPVNRYGTLAITPFPKEVENSIRTLPKQAYLFNIPDEVNVSRESTMLLTMGVIDNHKTYIGKLTLVLDFDNWINSLEKKVSHLGLIVAIFDNNQKILFAADWSRANADMQDAVFTHDLAIEPYHYKLAYGYNKPYLIKQLTKRALMSLYVFWAAVLALTMLLFFYKRKLKAHFQQTFGHTIASLTAANHSHIQEKEQIKGKFSKQIKVAHVNPPKYGPILS